MRNKILEKLFNHCSLIVKVSKFFSRLKQREKRLKRAYNLRTFLWEIRWKKYSIQIIQNWIRASIQLRMKIVSLRCKISPKKYFNLVKALYTRPIPRFNERLKFRNSCKFHGRSSAISQSLWKRIGWRGTRGQSIRSVVLRNHKSMRARRPLRRKGH